MGILSSLISVFTGAPATKVAEYFQERQQLKHDLKVAQLNGKIKIEEAKAQAAAAREAHLANWEMAQIANSGWKDEFVLLTISYPVYGSFIPYLQTNIDEGFRILGTTPAWYMGIVITVYLAIYGVRWKKASELVLGNKNPNE